jgi:Tfp pilus assembly protein FimT
MRVRNQTFNGAQGFTLLDIVGTIAVMATLLAVSVPPLMNVIDAYRMSMATRAVERELQFAKLKAVSAESPMRVRFNCPAAGQVRAVELIGTSAVPNANDADTYTNRCSESLYPYRATGSDTSRLTKPNNDGPVRYLDSSVTITASKTIEFWPDGTAHIDTNAGNPWPGAGNPGVTITLTRNGKTKNIVVNGLGKIQMDR